MAGWLAGKMVRLLTGTCRLHLPGITAALLGSGGGSYFSGVLHQADYGSLPRADRISCRVAYCFYRRCHVSSRRSVFFTAFRVILELRENLAQEVLAVNPRVGARNKGPFL